MNSGRAKSCKRNILKVYNVYNNIFIVAQRDIPAACRALVCAGCRASWQMNAVPRSPSRDVGVPHSVSCSPAGMVCTAVSLEDPQRPPAKVAGKDWERIREGPWGGKENSGVDGLEDEDMGRLGEVVVVVVRLPADPMQQEVKGFRWQVGGEK